MKKALLILGFLVAVSVSAQQEFIRGRLLDAETQEPIVFATVRVKGKSKGVISNQDGSFRVPQKFREYGDMLEISSMGYQTLERSIVNFSPNQINIIRLKPGIFELEGATVSAKKRRRLSAKAIVRKAIKAIPGNYPQRSFSTVGYYRDYQLKNAKYVNLNEAILEVFDPGFEKFDRSDTKVRIYDYLRNEAFERDTQADGKYNYKNWSKVIDKAYLYNYGGNEFTILRVHDAIRNHNVNSYDFVNRLDKDVLNNHNFYKEDDTFFDGEMLYTVSFRANPSGYRVYGRMYISKRDFAIYKMEYALYDNLKWNASKELNKHNNKKKLIFEVITEYARKYNQMYLSYISFQNGFQLSAPPVFIIKEITVDKALKCFEVRFNRTVDPLYAKQEKNYDFKFKGEKMDFKEIQVLRKSVRLYPDMAPTELNAMIAEIEKASNNSLQLEELLATEIKGLRDLNDAGMNSNLLNGRKHTNYQQFREYFVQRVKPNEPMPSDSLLMYKDRPIYKNQPISKPKDFDEYWMNTPLKTTGVYLNKSSFQTPDNWARIDDFKAYEQSALKTTLWSIVMDGWIKNPPKITIIEN